VELKRIAIDTSKHVFTLHGVDERERPVLRRNLKREQLEAFFAKQSPTEVVMEACGGAHHWGRFLSQLGHRVRLSALTACRCIGPPCGPIPAQYVKPFVKRAIRQAGHSSSGPFVKRARNDRADAEAISEAASRPSMPSVPVKSAQQQADAMILKHREMLTRLSGQVWHPNHGWRRIDCAE
jgi:transposase